MKRDPIVEEIHQTRQKILAECDGDLDRLMDRLKTAETQDHGRVVSQESFDETRRREHSPHQTN